MKQSPSTCSDNEVLIRKVSKKNPYNLKKACSKMS